MEIAGLAIGIPSIFSTCMDILDRVEAYKEFGIESRHAIAQFEAEKLRLRNWASGVGIADGKWKEVYDPRLEDRDLELAVKKILASACEVFEAAERTRSRLHERSDGRDDLQGETSREDLESKQNNIQASESIRGRLGWAFKRRGRFTNQVDMFAKIVDTLYNLLPPDNTSKSSNISRRIDGINSVLLWALIS
jgi:hypothetical protein